MTDIFDERKDMASTRSIAMYLKEKYDSEIVSGSLNMDVDERARITHLANNWPGNDSVRQLIKDATELMTEFKINPKDIKW